MHLITREIGIDMGHRVTHHGSKCRNLHGHRYTIEATCSGPLFADGEQQGMVIDFGFLKEIMMDVIDANHDHGMTLWIDDPWTPIFLDPNNTEFENGLTREQLLDKAKQEVAANGYYFYHTKNNSDGIAEQNLATKLYFVPFVPTAEHLAKHWFERLAPLVVDRTGGKATLHSIKVWETPNCAAIYPGVL